jgi:hypothetical protein
MSEFIKWAIQHSLLVRKKLNDPNKFDWWVTQLAWEAYQKGAERPFHDTRIQEGERVLLTHV